MPRISSPCRRCALALTTGEESLICGRCLKKPPPFDRTLAAFAYRFPVSQLVPRIKYHGQAFHLGWLGTAMARELSPRLDTLPDVLIPVPLAPSRLHQRGYNQAGLLASALARHFGLPLEHGLQKPRDTAHQMELSGEARRKNLRDAFRWAGPAWRHVALIDDVMTTGTTVGEIARLLKRSGVARVDIWVLARTPRPDDA